MSNVQRLSNVRRGVIQNDLARFDDLFNAKPFVSRFRLSQLGERLRFDSKVDKPRSCDFRNFQKVFVVKMRDDVARNLARRLAKLFAKRHCKIRLEISKLRILTRSNHSQVRFRINPNSDKRVGKTFGDKLN